MNLTNSRQTHSEELLSCSSNAKKKNLVLSIYLLPMTTIQGQLEPLTYASADYDISEETVVVRTRILETNK